MTRPSRRGECRLSRPLSGQIGRSTERLARDAERQRWVKFERSRRGDLRQIWPFARKARSPLPPYASRGGRHGARARQARALGQTVSFASKGMFALRAPPNDVVAEEDRRTRLEEANRRPRPTRLKCAEASTDKISIITPGNTRMTSDKPRIDVFIKLQIIRVSINKHVSNFSFCKEQPRRWNDAFFDH